MLKETPIFISLSHTNRLPIIEFHYKFKVKRSGNYG